MSLSERESKRVRARERESKCESLALSSWSESSYILLKASYTSAQVQTLLMERVQARASEKLQTLVME